MAMCEPSCVLYVATCVGGRCVCAADIDILLAAEAGANVFKVSALSSQPGVPEVPKGEGSEEREEREQRSRIEIYRE